ncbi:MAG: ribosomal protein S18-alanine N-acetyltransferase [Candidatus Obscuribacterales bacterium]|nr:ribosomal protein S18-alanine N-acetyltransferase [Candidatus Obscuribacterales bacterium]
MTQYKELKAIEIDALTLDDLEEVMEIEPIAFGSHHWSRDSFINELLNPAGFYFAARERETGRLIGYSGFWLIGEEAHITTLAVHPEHRRKRVGEQLLINDIVKARQLQADWMTLEVRVSNESAQRLYSKYSFKSLGVRRNYYQDNSEDALVLWTERLSTSDFVDVFKVCLAEQKITEADLNIDSLDKLFLGNPTDRPQ